jgi:hypothetical protein
MTRSGLWPLSGGAANNGEKKGCQSIYLCLYLTIRGWNTGGERMSATARFVAGTIALIAAALSHGPAASAETVRQVLQQFGLLGTWSSDCSRPPANNNFHTTFVSLPNGKVQRTYYSAPGKIYNQYVLERVNRISADQLFYRQKGAAGYVDVVLKKDGNRYHVLSSQNENGKIYVQDGKFTANAGDGSSAGKESPWETKCHD